MDIDQCEMVSDHVTREAGDAAHGIGQFGRLRGCAQGIEHRRELGGRSRSHTVEKGLGGGQIEAFRLLMLVHD